ncbi:glycosyltransferase family 4 protein [Dyadobacter pollutisoli]|uniref:Glycosyltransferase family 4 protein n=1 Tax=Dyadobacter pollutisoli TaxID=2910158 RepID=A0A9E8SKI9_9BACT|nr:glycosyltransferase family 4 protein [Dyadobacter pollutisoli]WAC11264.1 glycosyltransferase family 4 protein [Dyadobacter pollutisoli]
MHILLIHQYFLEDNGGGGSRWNEMSRIWVAEGHHVTVVAGTGHYMNQETGVTKKFFAQNVNSNSVRIIRCHVSRRYHLGFAGRLWAYFSFTLSATLGGILYARDRYDLVLVTSPPLLAGIAGLFISRWKRIPLVLEIRDLWPESAVDTGVLKNRFLIQMSYWLENQLYKCVRLINVLTPAFREVLIQEKKVYPSKIIMVPNAADFSLSEHYLQTFAREAFRRELKLENKFVVIYVGAHGVANHLIQILETADLLRDTNVLFLLIGDGVQKRQLMEEAFRMQLNNVRFQDPVGKAEIFKYILAADAGTSVLKKADTFKTIYSNKTFDYFSCKKPVLMAIDGISRQLVEEASAGIFVEPENPADFAFKIRQYKNDHTRCQAEGENGYQFARAHFDREILAKKYLEQLLALRKG